MSTRIPSFLLALALATPALGASPELRVEIHQPNPDRVLPDTEHSVEVVGGASIYGGVRYLDLFLVMDTSKSLRKTDPKDHRAAGAVALVRSLPASPDIRVGVVDFDGNTQLLSPLTADREAVTAVLEKLDRNGTTNIAAGIRAALQGFEDRPRPGATRVILLFTDGKSDAEEVRLAQAAALRRGVAIHSLLLGSDAEGESILRGIAGATGGSFVRVTDPAQLPEAFLNLRTTGVESVVLRGDGSAPIPARLSSAGTFSARVPVRPGRNHIVATAVSLTGEMKQAEVTLLVSGPLQVSIESPADGASLGAPGTRTLVEGTASLFSEAGEAEPGLGIRSVSLRVGDAAPVEAPLVDGRFRAELELPEGESRIVATAQSADGRTAQDTIRVSARTPGCAELQVEAVRGGRPALSISDRATLLIFDASNSMWGRMEGQPKISVAKQILGDALDWIPADLTLGLRVYGNRVEYARRDCRDSELLVPFAPDDRGRIRQAIAGFRPRGQTPLAYALEQAAADFGSFRGERAVVLVTDGIESCGGDPVAAARALQAQGPVPVHVIGFGLGGADADPSGLRAIAAASGGRFLTARNAAELREALAVSVGTPFQVMRGGTPVARGTLGGGDAIRLPEGAYTVHLESQPPYEVPVDLGRQEGLTLKLKREGDKVMLARSQRPIGYERCEVAPLGDVWEEVPARSAPLPAAPRP